MGGVVKVQTEVDGVHSEQSLGRFHLQKSRDKDIITHRTRREERRQGGHQRWVKAVSSGNSPLMRTTETHSRALIPSRALEGAQDREPYTWNTTFPLNVYPSGVSIGPISITMLTCFLGR